MNLPLWRIQIAKIEIPTLSRKYFLNFFYNNLTKSLIYNAKKLWQN